MAKSKGYPHGKKKRGTSYTGVKAARRGANVLIFRGNRRGRRERPPTSSEMGGITDAGP